MVTAVIYFDTTDPEGFVGALGMTGGLFEGVAGFNGFNVQRGVEDPNRFLLTADWNSVADHETWQEAHVEEFLGELNPHLANLPEIKHFE